MAETLTSRPDGEAAEATRPGPQRLRVGVFSRGLLRTENIGAFLDADIRMVKRWNAGESDLLIGWGRKKTAARTRRLAERVGRPYLTIEDGFLRSVGLGGSDPPLSVVVDDLGIYYDATAPSLLDALIPLALDEAQAARARALMHAWRAGRVSKYNHKRDYAGPLPERFVLVADQTYRDQSIRCGFADTSSFERMLAAAVAENPDCAVVVKTHPDVWAGKKKGNFNLKRVAGMPRVTVLAEDCHPATLLERAEAVYVVTSQLGFEALVWGRPVRCFGMPFYAGWGLTNDAHPAPSRRGSASIEQLVHAALVAYPRYIDPETRARCEVETVLESLALQRVMRRRFPPTIHGLGFSYWKRHAIRDFLGGSKVDFVEGARSIPPGATVAIWGNVPKEPLPEGAALIRVEDGFLRSIGLGAELRRPLSLALDPLGIYYDSRRPSTLEAILATHDFDAGLLQRAARLRERLVAERISKYNLGVDGWRRPDTSRPVLLVPGQVEDDASIRFGAPGIRRNIDLLRAVRENRRDAYVVYKPHPDVVAGLRDGGQDEERAAAVCDEIVTDASIAQMLAEVDEVHLLTSLTGFEALIRGKPVTCYGQPFYAGWGLTNDVLPVERRGRRLTLDELVAGSLILYPTYVSRTTGHFITAEQAVDSLLRWRQEGDPPLSQKAMTLTARVERMLKTTLRRVLRFGRPE